MGLKWSGATDEGETEIWPENARAAECFFALGTNWRVIAGNHAARYQGIEYVAVPAVMDLLGIKRKHRRDTFDRLRVIERAALEHLNKAR